MTHETPSFDPDTSATPRGQDDIVRLRQENERLRLALAASGERERLLVSELRHRVRNVLAVIRSIHRRTIENGVDPQAFSDHFIGRLDAIARYQSLDAGAETTGFELEDIVRDELVSARRLDGPGCVIAGPTVHLRQKTAELIGLAIHELATNSIKYGALAQDGDLDIAWSVAEGEGGPSIRFRWTERGMSPVGAAPRQIGFGRHFIEQALPYELGATTAFRLGPGSFECLIAFPLTGADDARMRFPGPPIASLPGDRA